MTDQERLENIKWFNATRPLTHQEGTWLIEQAEIKLQHDSIVEALVGEETLHQQGLLEPEVSRLTKENHALKCELGSLKAKAKNKERARRRKDNYINRLQNQLIAIKEVNKKRNQQLEQARESLGFYADEETYNLTGEKVYTGHGSYDESCWREIERDMGAKARQTLEGLK